MIEITQLVLSNERMHPMKNRGSNFLTDNITEEPARLHIDSKIESLVSSVSPTAIIAAEAALIFLTARGKSGKTFLTKYLIQRAMAGGRRLIACDADKTNASLSKLYPDALRPKNAGVEAGLAFLREQVNHMQEDRISRIFDFGAGDQTLEMAAREVDLVSWLEDEGFQPIKIHVLGPDLDDLSTLEKLERDLKPRRTLLCLNMGLAPNGLADEAFSPIMEHPIFQKTLERGAEIVSLPYLAPARTIEQLRLTFQDAALGRPNAEGRKLDGWDAQRTKMWLRSVNEAFEHVQAYLP